MLGVRGLGFRVQGSRPFGIEGLGVLGQPLLTTMVIQWVLQN